MRSIIFTLSIILVTLSILLSSSNAHTALLQPKPRTDDSGLKESPCGGKHPTLPQTISPGDFVLMWNETKCHNGSPFRVSLAFDKNDKSYVFHEYVLVDHIPHNDNCQVGEVYKYVVQIPDIKCDHCVLQLTQIMTDMPIKECPGSYPEQWITYYSCADINISGNTPIDEYVHEEQTPEVFPTGPYGYETGLWVDGNLRGEMHYQLNDLCPTDLPRVCNTDFNDKRHEGKNTFCVEWRIEHDLITFVIETTAMGWISLGLSETKDITVADAYMGKVSLETGITTFEDRHFAKGSHIPVVDATQNVISTTGLHIPQGEMIEAKVTRTSFTRKLMTGDSQDLDLVAGKKVYIFWAFHDTSQDFSVQHTTYFPAHQIDLFSSVPVSHSKGNSIKTHGLLMFFAWDIFAFAGIVVARYMRDRKGWFYVHAFLQIIACILVWSSISVIYKHIGGLGQKHFQGWHPAIGIFVFVFSILQPLIGFIAHYTREKNSSSTEVKPKKIQNRIHIYLGRMGIAFALVNIIAGLVLSESGMGLVAGAGIFIFIQCLIVFFLEVKLRRAKSSKFNPGPAPVEDEIDDDIDDEL